MLLQKQDDKMVLKCHSKSTIAVQEGKQMLSPIIKLDSVFLREVATGELPAVPETAGRFPRRRGRPSDRRCLLLPLPTDRKAFYVIFTWDSGAQIYELVAQSVGERKM